MSPHLSPNPLEDIDQLLTYPFMVNAFAAATLVALTAAVAGWFMVLRRETFAGHTLAVMSFPGAAGAALAGLPLAAGSFGSCAAAATVIAAGSHHGRGGARRDSSLTATVQVAGFALGFLFLGLYHGIVESLENLLFGSFLGITPNEVWLLAAVGAGVLGFFVLAGRPLFYASVDVEVARARGVPVRMLHVAFLLVLGLTVAATAQITGILLVFALLVAPAAAAQKMTACVRRSLLLTVAGALVVAWLGLSLAYFTDLSVGFLVTSVAFALYLLASLRARLRH